MFSLVAAFAVNEAEAAQTLRVQVDQKGDFLLIGNTLGHECATGTPAPVVGVVGTCGQASGLPDSAPDVFWRSEAPAAGQAQANNSITVAQARSTAILTIPMGATVTHAFLYWGANLSAPGSDSDVTLDRPGGFTHGIAALQTYTYVDPNNNQIRAYQGVADITPIVQAQGSGAYRVSGVDSANVIDANNNANYAGWWMVVLYELATDPPRNLALFDGFDNVNENNPQNLTLSGFLVPPVFTAAKLGVVTFEGDNSIPGDSFSFGPAPVLSDMQNPADNFFNGTHSFLGAAVSTVGDLPQLTGTPQSMSGIDIDVLDVTSKLMAGQTSVPIAATSTLDNYYLAGFVTSIPTFKPDFSTSEKTAVDVNGGSLRPGDVVEYTIVATSTGNDAAINTVLTDPLPMGVTYAPNSISITAGANVGMKTDMTGDDQCDYSAGTRTVICRLGAMANATMGGHMSVGESSTVSFRVTIDATASGTILNQATITAGGLLGAPAEGTPTDGNGATNGGQPPTPIIVEVCDNNSHCVAPAPYCNTTADPNVCVECLQDAHCPSGAPTCEIMTNTCICVPSGMEVCDSKDNDCDGTVDNGCGDSDADGLPDEIETNYGTNLNDADSDDDGVPDGQEANWNVDSDGDGLINVLDPDSDNDGLFDGTEIGFDCASPGTDLTVGSCIPDADKDAPPTSPIDWDSDDGGISDGSEDINKNGKIDPGEGNPLDPSDDSMFIDTDGDGLTDKFETEIGSELKDADTDDDGVTDGYEANPAADSDGDGLINVLDPDSDNDGLFDGTEMGFDCASPGTDLTVGSCIPDADKDAPPTSPIDWDSDDGGLSDGSEDFNKNGKIDPGEGNPLDPSDDSIFADSDHDGLTDVFESEIGSDSNDADSDDDGVIDGQEPNPANDSDGDGLINLFDHDSDNDGLFDGTEMGFHCSNPATNLDAGKCTPDDDDGATKTSPLKRDTDNGGVSDGYEDFNHNGRLDPGEGDPLDPFDDSTFGQSPVCGNAILTANETCDDGNTFDDDGCDSNCTPTSCGNNVITTGEMCDDGNTKDGDGCSASCQVEMGGGNGGTGGAPNPEPPGCDCSTPGKAPTTFPFWIALPVTLCLRRRRQSWNAPLTQSRPTIAQIRANPSRPRYPAPAQESP